MTNCPDCGSDSVQSKGNKQTKHGVAHRYVCNNCGRNFTVNPNKPAQKDNIETTNEVKKEGEQMKTSTEEKKLTTIQIDSSVRAWLEGLKVVKQEPINSVLTRIKNKEVVL